REHFDDVLKLMTDRDNYHILVPNLSNAIELRVDLHRVHAVTQPLNFHPLRKLLERPLIFLFLGVEHEGVSYRDVPRSGGLTYRGICDPEMWRLRSIHIEPDVVLCHCSIPLVHRGPPIRFPTKEDAECRRPLLAIHNPQGRPLSIVCVLLFYGPATVPH